MHELYCKQREEISELQQSMRDHDQISGTMLKQVLTKLTMHREGSQLKSLSTKTAGLMALLFCGKQRTTGLSDLKLLWK